MEVIEASGAEAVHPGYGFLAENAAFAKRLEDADITFIGPPASAIEAMGSKTRARELMQKAGVPIVPGTTDPVETLEDAEKIAEEIGYPIAVKAAGGGGGKGFRVALEADKLKDAFEGAAREGEKFFSDDTVYLERYLPDPRHVEVQVLADKHGTVVHLGERDCSIQRRHQKLIEESPRPAGRRGAAREDRQDRHRRGRGRRLPRRGHDRGPAPGRRVLLPRDEHPRPGRALRDRGDDGHRHRARAGPRRRGREALVRAGGHPPARPRDRVPHQRRGRLEELRPRAGHGRPLPRAVGPRRARRLRRGQRHRDHAAVRPDGRQADRLGRRPRARHPAHAARAGGVRDRGRQDPDPVPQGDHGLRAVGEGRDLPRPDRGQGLAEGARLRGRAGGRRRRRGARGAHLHRRGLGQALRRRRARRADRRRRRRRRQRRRPQAAPKRERKSGGGGGSRRRHARLAAAGQRLEGDGRAGRRRRGGRARLHHRGDEDGERDLRPQGRNDRRAGRPGGRRGEVRRHDRDHQVAPSDGPR